MRIYKKLEDSLDDMIRVGDIVAACKRAEECNKTLAERALTKACEGNDSVLSAYVWFTQQQRIYCNEVPNLITCIINEPLQTEEANMEDK